MSNFKGKVALITGGTSGIGHATAKAFLNAGAFVIITGRYLETVNETVLALGQGASGIVSDAGSMKDVLALADKVKEIHSAIDILFVNAGYGKFAPIEYVDVAHFDEQFNILVKGSYFTVQQLLPLLKPGATIILNTSVVTEKGMPGASVYSAAKSAVQSLTKTLANELIQKGIRLNAVSPGPIETSFMEKTGMDQQQIQGFAENVIGQVPMKRFGKSEEVANVVLFLASDASSYLLGTEIYVDGGMVQV
jgi:NAD(P)-dependent dehydrogenase (short-subunit alcohol dehydrogenase family)